MTAGPGQPADTGSSGAAGAGAAPGTRQERHCVVAYGEAFGPLLTEPDRGANQQTGFGQRPNPTVKGIHPPPAQGVWAASPNASSRPRPYSSSFDRGRQT